MAKRLPLPYRPQKGEGYCLAACAQMVLDYLGHSGTQDDIARQLGITSSFGVPISRLSRLHVPGVAVQVQAYGQWSDLARWLEQNTPVVAAVQAGELPYWGGERFQHAVVIVGLDGETVSVLDPATLPAPIDVSQGDFQLAWDEMDGRCGVIRRV